MSTLRLRRTPSLAPGDHLSAEEFWRRYEAMPDVKAELVEGIVYMPSPLSFSGHAEPHFDLQSWLGIYKLSTPGVRGADNATLTLPSGINVVQPDLALFLADESRCRVDDRGYLAGVPDWIGEVSASSASYDSHEKLRAYERNKVREYVIWRVEDERIDWYVLRGGKFKPLARSIDGWFKSKAFPGLWLDPQALMDRDHPRLLAALNEGMRSPEYLAFAEKLRVRSRTKS